MFKQSISDDLKKIFGVKKVLFDSFGYGREQDIIYCNVHSARPIHTSGRAWCYVGGDISIAGDFDKLQYGFLHKQIEMADVNTRIRFSFGRDEETIHYTANGDKFTKYTVDFLYTYKAEFNPPDSKIEDININIEVEDN